MSVIRNQRQRHPALIRGTMLGLAFLVSFVVGFAYAGWAMVCRAGRCPAVATLDSYEPLQTSKLYGADGRFVAELGLERRTLVKIADIPPLVRNAFIVTEDKRFYQHSGIDWSRIPGAVYNDLRTRAFSQGFSTITMQLARNIFPERISREKTLVRKLKEAKVAREIEQRYSKDKILELYLNQIYLGNGAFGVETASERYFGKSVKELNVDEAATLAALPKDPTAYNPRRFPDRSLKRRNTIIELLRAQHMIADADASTAKAYPLNLASKTVTGELAPYFVEYVRELLDDKFGTQLYQQGLNVYTTLDVDLQSAAERALEHQIKAIESGKAGTYTHTTYESYVAHLTTDDTHSQPNSPYLQGAFLAMDPRSGAIRAMVGGRDFDDNKFNRATQALRQPGSTFKPIVYSEAIHSGRPLSYLIEDLPLSVPVGDGPPWTPQNFDGRYEGAIPLRRALYESRNIPAIRMGMELGAQSVIDMARAFGLTTPIPAYPSIYIGAAEVYPIELISAYTAFATLGTRAQPQAIVKVESAKGEVLWQPDPVRAQVLSPEEAWLMVSMMKDVIRKGSAAGTVGSLFNLPAGGKTGTTNDGADVWFIGYTSDLVAGVWMGFDRPQKIKSNAQGGLLAAPAWTAFMNEVYHRKPAPADWPMPADLITKKIDASTNMLATQYCPAALVTTETYIPGTDPIVPCNVHGPNGMTDTTNASTAPPPLRAGDTSRARADSAFVFPPRGGAGRGTTVFTPHDTTGKPRDTTRKRDTLRTRDTGVVHGVLDHSSLSSAPPFPSTALRPPR